MTGVQEHTLQLTWRFYAGYERAIGHLQVDRQQWTRKDESWHARVHAREHSKCWQLLAAPCWGNFRRAGLLAAALGIREGGLLAAICNQHGGGLSAVPLIKSCRCTAAGLGASGEGTETSAGLRQ